MIKLDNAIIFIIIGSLKEDLLSTGMFGMYFRGTNPINRLYLNKQGDILKIRSSSFYSFKLEVDVKEGRWFNFIYVVLFHSSSLLLANRPIVPTYDVLVKFNYLHLALVFFDDICSDDKVLDLKVEKKKR